MIGFPPYIYLVVIKRKFFVAFKLVFSQFYTEISLSESMSHFFMIKETFRKVDDLIIIKSIQKTLSPSHVVSRLCHCNLNLNGVYGARNWLWNSFMLWCSKIPLWWSKFLVLDLSQSQTKYNKMGTGGAAMAGYLGHPWYGQWDFF